MPPIKRRALPKKKKAKLTDAERHKRFLEMAKQVGASDDPEDFERAFKTVTATRPRPPKETNGRP